MFKKHFIKLFLLLSIFFSIIFSSFGVNFNDANNATTKISSVSINKKQGTLEEQVKTVSNGVFKIFKIIIGSILVLYLVYTGVMMIWAMGDNEEDIKKAKNSLRYAGIGLVFINVPGSIYDALSGKRTVDSVSVSSLGDQKTIYDRNIFINSQMFGNILGGIVSFLEVAIIAFAIFMFVLQGIHLIRGRGDEEIVKEAKHKILYGLMALIFLGVLEVWRNIIFTSNIPKGKELFSSLTNLALFFAGPIAIFYITLAGYYYITAAGNDEKIKKAKNIIINTVIATLLILGVYTFLLDLKGLSFN